jgi:hypothetical protein
MLAIMAAVAIGALMVVVFGVWVALAWHPTALVVNERCSPPNQCV